MDAAIEELFYVEQSAQRIGLNPETDQHVLAAFSQRVGLDITGVGEASSRLASEAVRSHMRTLVGVANRSMVLTKTASEPMHAIAAATQLSLADRCEKAVEKLISRIVLKGTIIEKGLQGELFTRFLLIFARDQPDGSNFVSGGTNPSVTPVCVGAFLKALLGDELGLTPQINDRTGVVDSGLKRMQKCRSNLLDGHGGDGWINFIPIVQLEQSIDSVSS